MERLGICKVSVNRKISVEGGDRSKVRVCEDKWLPANYMPKLFSPKPDNWDVMKV